MIISLFSSFDPLGGFLNLNFFILLISASVPLTLRIFILPTRSLNLTKNINSLLERELASSIPNKNKKGKINILLSLFSLVLILNLRGLIPYIFTLTAQILFTFSLALPFWLGFISFRFLKNTNNFFSHLVPLRTPLPLSQFMVLIETVRQIIRPITLSVRLAANITAGHILIALCSSTINILNSLTIVLIILIILETAVALIQSYVFTVLISMYIRETYDKSISPLSPSFSKTLTFNSEIIYNILIIRDSSLIPHKTNKLNNN